MGSPLKKFTLTAAANTNAGFTFTGWSEIVASDGTVTNDQDQACQANFTSTVAVGDAIPLRNSGHQYRDVPRGF